METSHGDGRRNVGRGPEGLWARAGGKDGPQVIRSKGDRWTQEAEAAFLDYLAASCNVLASCEAAGFCNTSVYKRRREDAAFAERWQAALEQGYARIEMALVQRAADALEGFKPDPDTPIPVMTVEQALKVLERHRATVERGPPSRRRWTRPRTLDEVSDSIMRKLATIAPTAFGTGPPPATPASERAESSGGGSGERGPPPAPPAGGKGEPSDDGSGETGRPRAPSEAGSGDLPGGGFGSAVPAGDGEDASSLSGPPRDDA
jgi:hypothetical protein